MLQDWKIYCLQAHLSIFQPGNVTGWSSEGVKASIGVVGSLLASTGGW